MIMMIKIIIIMIQIDNNDEFDDKDNGKRKYKHYNIR